MLRSFVNQQCGVVFKPGYCMSTITRRYFSNHDMMEAFGAPPSKPVSNSISNSSKSSAPTDSKPEKKIDPTVNINRDFTSSLSPTNSVNGTNSGTLDQVFGSSLNDFSALENDSNSTNWSNSFHGLGIAPFSKESQEILYTALPDNDIEITPDGLLYLPEIKYRRILNRAFGAGAWGLAPRSATLVSKQGMGGLLTREYGLIVHGRLVSIARGEQTFFNEKGIPTATEGCKSNALMRCCKDLGIASELWDPRFIKSFKKKNCEDLFVEYIPTKKKKKIWKRKDEAVEYPFKK